ncbi:hypothetical protein [Nonomuraea africana]|uniref:hypothetical protein n=1 Tax=Nonomuraea africana TaxID=46171 RepID=UPI0033F1AF3B
MLGRDTNPCAGDPASQRQPTCPEEFAALGLVPDGLAPAPVLLEQSPDNPLGSPYMVTGHVPGRERGTASIRPLSGWRGCCTSRA